MEINYEIYYRVIARKIMDAIKSGAKTSKDKGYSFKKRGKRGGRIKEWPIEVTYEQILERIIQIEGKCEKTGWPFPLVLSAVHYTKQWARKLGFNPGIVPSCDRIDPKKGYTIDNIQIVIRFYNLGKNSLTQEEIDELMSHFDLTNIPTEHTIYEEIKNNNININLKIKTMNKELLNYFIDQNEFDKAEKYFEYCNNKVTTKKNSNNTDNSTKRRTMTHSERKDWFEKNREFVNNCSDSMLSITALCLNKSGHADNSKVFQTKWSQKIIDNKLKVYALPSGRGVEYFINKEDRDIIGK